MHGLMAFLVVAAVAAVATSDEKRVASGEWGGLHARLTVADDGGRLDLDCAHGTVEAMKIGDGGRFDVAGRYAREHGGPIRKGEDQDGVSARYRGTIKDQTMTLEIAFEDGSDTVGPFELTLGGRARVFKCK